MTIIINRDFELLLTIKTIYFDIHNLLCYNTSTKIFLFIVKNFLTRKKNETTFSQFNKK